MQLLKLRVHPWQQQILLAGATAFSLAVAMPSMAQSEGQGAIRLPVDRSQQTYPSADYWGIGWKIVAGLGLLSGMSSLAIDYFFVWPKNVDTRKRLRGLEAERPVMEKLHQDLNDLKDKSTGHETKADQEFSKIVSQLTSQGEATRSELSSQQAAIANLINELQLLKQQFPVPGSRYPATMHFDSDALSLKPIPAPPPAVSHADEVTAEYSSAVQRNDRNKIRQMTQAELNITQDSEDALTRGTSICQTQLQSVSGGGSYLLIPRGGRNWLCPTTQTLAGFTKNKPQKGIFEYEECTSVTTAELKQPAEVQQIHEEIWEVINKGIVVVPI